LFLCGWRWKWWRRVEVLVWICLKTRGYIRSYVRWRYILHNSSYRINHLVFVILTLQVCNSLKFWSDRLPSTEECNRIGPAILTEGLQFYQPFGLMQRRLHSAVLFKEIRRSSPLILSLY
jgi:hypothetical protein